LNQRWLRIRVAEFGLDDWLPLRVNSTFDLFSPAAEAAWDDAAWQAVGQKTPPPSLGQIAWMHELAAAPGAKVWATCGEHPLIATTELGQGRVAAVAAAPLGPAENAFWTSPAWEQVQHVLLNWLLQGNRTNSGEK
jgi:hypothetical protein